MQSISELRNTEFQESRVDKIIFYKSELMPQGPKYTILKHLSLGWSRFSVQSHTAKKTWLQGKQYAILLLLLKVGKMQCQPKGESSL